MLITSVWTCGKGRKKERERDEDMPCKLEKVQLSDLGLQDKRRCLYKNMLSTKLIQLFGGVNFNKQHNYTTHKPNTSSMCKTDSDILSPWKPTSSTV